MRKYISKQLIITLITIISLLTAITISSYALFFRVKETKEEVVKYGDLKVEYKTGSNTIIRNADAPKSDEEGLSSEEYIFKITNTGTLNASYEVIINDDTEYIEANKLNKVNDDYMKYSFTPGEPKLVSGLENNVIKNGALRPGESIQYYLKFWLKSDAPNESIGKSFVKKLKVKASYTPNLFKTKVEPISGSGAETIIKKYSQTNTEGIIKIEQPETKLMPETTEYRYSGSNDVVKNYISFNNEIWRIIGVFDVDDGTGKYEKRIKLIKEESIGNYSWDTSEVSVNTGYGVNQWGESGSYEGADLMRLLNPGYSGIGGSLYWNKASGTCYSSANNGTKSCDFTNTGLNDEAKSIISESKWNLAATTNDQSTTNMYKNERGTTVGPADTGLSITKTNNWIGKVGLMNASDYGYSSSSCYNGSTSLYNYETSCKNSSWIYNSIPQWTLVLSSGYSTHVFEVNSIGRISNYYAYNAYGVRPVIYLKSGVKITSGDGSSSNPYKLS